MGGTTIIRVQEWLRSAEWGSAAAFEAVRDLLRAPTCDLDQAANADEAFAVRFSPGSEWTVLIPIDSEAIDDADLVVVTAGSASTTSREQLWDDAEFWVTPESLFDGLDSTDNFPLALDGSEWAGTVRDLAYGASDWQLQLVGDDRVEFFLDECVVRYAETSPVAPKGLHIDLAEGGASMSTGDIGWSVSVDDQGSAWQSIWGCDQTFLGRATEPFSPYPTLEQLPMEAAYISTDVYPVERFREVVEWAADCVDYLDPDTPVRCVGFDGTAEEFYELAGLRRHESWE